MKKIQTLIGLLGLMLLAGCETVPPIPLELQYAAPAPSAETATIIGSEIKSVLLDNFTVYVNAVDGKRVMAQRKGWNQPLVLNPGRRVINVEYNRGVFISRAEFEIEVTPGGRYEVKFSSDGQFMSAHTYCEYWVIDQSSGKAITPIVKSSVSGGSTGGYVPIFIPVR